MRGNVVMEEQNQNMVRYEFGPCLYFAYTFGFVQMLLGIFHLVKDYHFIFLYFLVKFYLTNYLS